MRIGGRAGGERGDTSIEVEGGRRGDTSIEVEGGRRTCLSHHIAPTAMPCKVE